ncbi:MAG: glycosyltransferase family 39 protein [Hyphomicrobiaceae bacterium]|nr:MAG: glycosyltransferase family 39 protein [Hyphomicrobiaceae bacterium]
MQRARLSLGGATDIASPVGSHAGTPIALIGAVALAAVVRALVAQHAGLTDDEAYYRLWALAPAMSYLDHPPMVGWMMASGRWIAGDTALGIRLGGILTSLIGPIVLWRTAAILFDRHVAQWAVWLALAMPLLAVGGVIVTPDTPSVLFWGLAAWAAAELHVSRNANWWIAVGAFSGLGLLSKYTNLFAGAAIALWIVLLPANRVWLRCWQLWAGGTLAFVIALPVAIWNWHHDWASFAKQFGRAGVGGGITARFLPELGGAFLGLASPVIAVLAVWGLGIAVRRTIEKQDPAAGFLAFGIAPLLAYFLFHALHDRVQPNWLAPVYPALAICAALALSMMRPHAQRRAGSAAVVIGLLVSGLIYVHALRPIVMLSGIKDPTFQMHGWTAFAEDIDAMRTANGAVWIATSSYATTGQLAFHLANRAPVVQLTERLRYVHLPKLDRQLLGSDAIYVDQTRYRAEALLRRRFRSVTPLGRISRSYLGVPLASFEVYRVAGPTTAVLGP